MRDSVTVDGVVITRAEAEKMKALAEAAMARLNEPEEPQFKAGDFVCYATHPSGLYMVVHEQVVKQFSGLTHELGIIQIGRLDGSVSRNLGQVYMRSLGVLRHATREDILRGTTRE